MKWLTRGLLVTAVLAGTLLVGIRYGAAQYSKEDAVCYLVHPAGTSEMSSISLTDVNGAKMICVASKDASGQLQLALYDLTGGLKSVYVAVTKREGKPDLQNWREVFSRPKPTKFDLTPIGEEPTGEKDKPAEGKAGGKAPGGTPEKAPEQGKGGGKAEG